MRILQPSTLEDQQAGQERARLARLLERVRNTPLGPRGEEGRGEEGRGEEGREPGEIVAELRDAIRSARDLREPELWGDLVHELALVQEGRRDGNRRLHRRRAVRLYHHALEVRDRRTDPERWIETARELAGIHLDLLPAGTTEMELAAGLLREIIDMVDPDEDPETCVEVHANLGHLLMEMTDGDTQRHREEAVSHLQRAADLESDLLERGEASPCDLATTLCGLGVALARRMDSEETHDLALAEANLRQAVTLAEDGDPDLHSHCLGQLGCLLFKKGDLENAAERMAEAIALLGDDAEPAETARLRLNLATTHLAIADSRAQSERRREAIERARHLLSRSLDVFRSEGLHVDRAWALRARAHAHELQNRPAAAIADYRAALTVLDPEQAPAQGGRTAYHLADLLAHQNRWPEAAAVYRRALRAVNLLHAASAFSYRRRSTLSLVTELHADAAWALARAEAPLEAALTLERGRARRIADSLESHGQARIDLQRLRPDLAESLSRAFDDWRHVDQDRRPAARELPSLAPRAEQARDCYRRVEEIVGKIRQLEGMEHFLRPAEADHLIAASSPRRPLLYLAPTDLGTLALVVSRKAEPRAEAFFDEGMTLDDLDALIAYDDPGVFQSGYVPAQSGLHPRFSRFLEKILDRAGGAWLPALAGHLREMEARGVKVIAGGRTSLLPIHALRFREAERETCLLDEFEVSYAPSAKALAVRREAEELPWKACRLGALADSQPDSSPLQHARKEARSVAALFPRSDLRHGRSADREFLDTALSTATHLLLACHGRFHGERPMLSHVRLADGRWTVADLLQNPPSHGLRLAVLSACQSGLSDLGHVPDEGLGLAGCLLEAGVPAVVASLWPVPDLSTALLVEKFFAEHLPDRHGGGRTCNPATALRKAQLWLRSEARGGRFSHAYHWAAFGLHGT